MGIEGRVIGIEGIVIETIVMGISECRSLRRMAIRNPRRIVRIVRVV